MSSRAAAGSAHGSQAVAQPQTPPGEDQHDHDQADRGLREGREAGPEQQQQDHEEHRRPLPGPDRAQRRQGRGDGDQQPQHPLAQGHPRDGHRTATRGSWERRASRRSTSSRVPGPRQATTGQPVPASRSSSRSPLHPPHPPGQVGHPARDALAGGGTRLLGQRVDHHHREPPAHQRGGRARHHLAEHRRQHHHHRPGGDPELERLGGQVVRGARSDPGELAQDHPQVPGAGAVADHLPGAAHDPQGHAVPGPAVVLGEGGRGPHRHVEAARGAVHAAGGAVVGQRVHHHEHRRVLLGPGVHDVQLVRSQRDAPVDAPQPVAGVEGPDAGELGAVPDPARAVRPDQPHRLGQLGVGVERRGRGQHLDEVAGEAHRPPAVAGPPGREGDLLLAQQPPAPAPRADEGVGDPGLRVQQRPHGPVRRAQREVRRPRGDPGDVLDVVDVAQDQPRRGALALVQHRVGQDAVRLRLPGRPVEQARGRRGPRTARSARSGPGPRRAPRGPARSRPPAPPGPGRRWPATASSPAHRVREPSSVDGVGTEVRTASTTRRPEASVIHSSGRTVIRCASTARATAFTSSGMT